MWNTGRGGGETGRARQHGTPRSLASACRRQLKWLPANSSLFCSGLQALRQDPRFSLEDPICESPGVSRLDFLLPRTPGGLPWLLLGFDLPDDILHPQHEVTHHAEEAELVPRVHQPHPAALAGIQQGLPGFQDLVLPLLDVVSLVTCIGCLEAGRILL